MFRRLRTPIFAPVTSHALIVRGRQAGITTTVRVRRDPREQDLWWVGRLDYSGTWRIAAAEPCCPLCGSDLEAGVRVKEDVG